MNEDGSHQYSANDAAAEVEGRGPPLGSETTNEIAGKFIVEKSTKPAAAAAGELMHGISSRMQSRLFEMHGDPVRHSPYGLWMSADGTAVMGNGDRRNEVASHDGLVRWSSLLPVSSVAPATTDRNIPFERAQKLPKCNTEAAAPTITRSSNTERMGAASDSDLVLKLKDSVDFRPGREHEQFNLWKIASLIRGISPSDKGKGKESDVRGDTFPRGGSLMDDGKIAERFWTFGPSDRHVKPKSLSSSSALSYPVYGSKTGNMSDSDPSSNAQLLGENTTVVQLSNDASVPRSQSERFADDQPVAFVPSLKTVEDGKKHSDVVARTKLSMRLEDSGQFSVSARNEHELGTQDTETRGVSIRGAVKGINSVIDSHSTADNRQGVSVGSLRDDAVTSRSVAASQLASLPTESALSAVTGHDNNAPASSDSNNGISLYRRRVKSLLLKRGDSLTEGFQEAEMPRSPRIQNHFGTAAFSSSEVSAADNGCGNFHEENCCQEHTGEAKKRGTVCSSPTESSYKIELVAAGCGSGDANEQEKLAKHDKVPPGTSYGVVNYAVASSGILSEDYHRPHVTAIDCSYAGHVVEGDGVRYGCVAKAAALQVPGGGLCCHDACGHSVCQQHCTTDIATHRLSQPSCHLPPAVKQSPTAVCEMSARCRAVAHRLGALPTPTRACAAALCQLSCVPPHGSPRPSDSSSASGCLFGRPKSAGLCGTPGGGHQAVQCACLVRDAGCLPPVHHQPACSYTAAMLMAKSSSVRGCLARSFVGQQDDQQQGGEVAPCMAHTPYTPRESAYSPREPDTPQDHTAAAAAGGVCEPCTPHGGPGPCSSHRAARKHPGAHTPSAGAAACYFQFPPAALHAGQLDCQSPCLSCTTRRLQCQTPYMTSPLNLTVGHHPCTPQCCCIQHQLLTARHRPTCVRSPACFLVYYKYKKRKVLPEP